jgi:adenylate cyclase
VVSGADIRTFLFADMRGYTQFTQDQGDDAASALAGRFADLVREAVPEFEGELLELRGDEALCVFRSARQALRAAVELQRRLRIPTDDEPAFPLGVGMGLDAGEAVATHGGYRGKALNLAARLCGVAAPGEVLATEEVAHLAHRVDGIQVHGRRAVRIKGVAEPVRLVSVTPEQPFPPLRTSASSRTPRRRWPMLVTGVVALLVAAVGLYAVSTNAGRQPGSASVPIRPNSIAVIDAATGVVQRDIPLAATPGEVTAGAGGIWVGEDASNSVVHIAPRSGRVDRTVGLGIDPAQMLVAFGSLWAYDAVDNRIAIADTTGRQPLEVRRLLPRCPARLGITGQPLSKQGACGAGGIASDGTGVWLGRGCLSAGCSGTGAWRVSPDARTITRRVDFGGGRLAYGAGALWVYSNEGTVGRIDLQTGHRSEVSIPAWPYVTNNPGLTYAFGAAWVVSPDRFLREYTPAGLQATIHIPEGGYDITPGGRWLWVTSGTGILTQINPYTQSPVHHYHLRYPLEGVAYADHRIWVAVGDR